MDENKKKNVRKPLEEMNVIDNFLFTEIMADDEAGLEACRVILSCVLKREVKNISFTAQKTVPGVSEQSHGVRMDAYVEEEHMDSSGAGDKISVYDVEPDKRSSHRASLPKRSRYYADIIDSQLVKVGTDYDRLPELVTIFILSYDPFGEKAMYYEAGTVIKSHPDVLYNDGIRRIFLYVNGELPENAGEDERKLQAMLKYINESTATNVTDDNTKRLDEIVRSTKAKKDVGIRYMKSWEIEKELREEAREEGLEEGRAEGRAEGREEQRVYTEREKIRADKAEKELKAAQNRIIELEELLAAKQ